MCTVVTYLIKDCNKWMVLVVSLLIGIVFGYDASLFDIMPVSATLCLYPFYWLGYVMDRNKIENQKRTCVRTGGQAYCLYI